MTMLGKHQSEEARRKVANYRSGGLNAKKLRADIERAARIC